MKKGCRVMSINLNNCKTGDKVTTRDGRTGIYKTNNDGCNPLFPHRIMITNFDGEQVRRTFTHEGQFAMDLSVHGLDIVVAIQHISDSDSIGCLAASIKHAAAAYHGSDLVREVALLIQNHPSEVNSCIGDVPEK